MLAGLAETILAELVGLNELAEMAEYVADLEEGLDNARLLSPDVPFAD